MTIDLNDGLVVVEVAEVENVYEIPKAPKGKTKGNEMNGTEKQIKWAKDIQTQAINMVRAIWYEDELFCAKIIEKIENMDDAKFFIDNRSADGHRWAGIVLEKYGFIRPDDRAEKIMAEESEIEIIDSGRSAFYNGRIWENVREIKVRGEVVAEVLTRMTARKWVKNNIEIIAK
jgi:hypothetical protein